MAVVEKELSGLGMPCIDWETAEQTQAVRNFKDEVIDYNAAENSWRAMVC